MVCNGSIFVDRLGEVPDSTGVQVVQSALTGTPVVSHSADSISIDMKEVGYAAGSYLVVDVFFA